MAKVIVKMPQAPRKGLGRVLLGKMIRYCRSRRTRELTSDVLRINTRMIALARGWGCEIVPSAEPGAVKIRLALQGIET